jgi:hypothetical protein
MGSGPCVSSGRFAAGLARAQHVEADAPDDGRQPGSQVLDVAGIGPAEADPRLLDGIVRLGQRAEHAVRDAAQMGAVFLEAAREPVLIVHASMFLRIVWSPR